MNIIFHKNWSIGKARVMGNCYSNPVDKQIQKHEETIYYCGFFSIIITHNMKFDYTTA